MTKRNNAGKTSKASRQKAAALAAIRRQVTRVYSLSFAVMRTQVAFTAFDQEAGPLLSGAQSADQIVADLPRAIGALEVTPFVRVTTFLQVYLGLLYGAVEAWRKWEFEDHTVTTLLQSPFTKTLKDYRDSVFHVTPPTDKRQLAFGSNPERVRWTKDLLAAMQNALLRTHAAIDATVAAEARGKPA